MMYAKLLIPCNVSKIFSQKFIKLNVIDTMLHYFSKKNDTQSFVCQNK